MFVLILVDLVGLLRLCVHSLRLLAFLDTELLQFLWTMKDSAHHDLAGHREASWIHLPEDDGLALTWLDFDVVARALLRLLHLQLVKFGVVDVLAVLRLILIIDDVDVTVALLSHGKVLSDSWSALLSKVGGLALSKLLLGARGHEHADQIVLLPLALLVTKEDGLGGTVAAD